MEKLIGCTRFFQSELEKFQQPKIFKDNFYQEVRPEIDSPLKYAIIILELRDVVMFYVIVNERSIVDYQFETFETEGRECFEN